MTNATIARVTGVYDVFPPQINRYHRVEAALTRSFEQYGYTPIALPLIEHSELYLRKAGENIVSQMYDFQHRGRRLCLRPEMTASTMRAYIERMQDWALPARFYYAGPVFRYEKPQNVAYRQFTQVGLELIGAGGALADAEVIRAACAALDAVGLKRYNLVIGHVGILNAFLNNLDIDGQLRSFLLLNMETLRTQGDDHLRERLRELYPAFGRLSAPTEAAPGGDSADSMTGLFQMLRGMPGEEARALVIELLESLNLKLDENRDPDEITERLLTKLRRGDQTAALDTALAFMSQLSQLNGEPQSVLFACKKLLTNYNVGLSVIGYIDDLLRFLDVFSVPADRITLDLGISLGLQYYTGLIFEIHHDSVADGHQLCGGGRYDDLIEMLGGSQPQPATGFSFGLEWVCSALEAEGHSTDSDEPAAQVFVAAGDDAGLVRAVQVAEHVRALGWRAELGLSPHTTGDCLSYAQHRRIPLLITVTAQPETPITLYNTHTQQTVSTRLSDLAQVLHIMESPHE